MGNWNINIQGVGCHHNGSEADADRLAAEFVKVLRDAGHLVGSAMFTYGSAEEVAHKAVPDLPPAASTGPAPATVGLALIGLCGAIAVVGACSH